VPLLLSLELKMYKVEIEFGVWEDSKVTIETTNFEIVKALQTFVEWQDSVDWIGEYIMINEDDEEDFEDEEEESEEK
jgi:hypothetical protein